MHISRVVFQVGIETIIKFNYVSLNMERIIYTRIPTIFYDNSTNSIKATCFSDFGIVTKWIITSS